MARFGWAGRRMDAARRGLAGPGEAGPGLAWPTEKGHGRARPGAVRLGVAGRGVAWLGRQRRDVAWHGETRCGAVRQGPTHKIGEIQMAKEKEIAVAEPGPVHVESTEPMSLLRMALVEKVPVEILERIAALEERVAARNARDSFFRALSDFQSEIGPIPKTSAIKVTRGGTTEVRSRYASLDKIVEYIRPFLRTHGFIYHWNSIIRENGNVCITCFLRHIDGHTESADFEFAQKDASAPGMNGVQIAGSARTYGERYSLIQVLGLTTADPDDDGNAAGGSELITAEQVQQLHTKIIEVGAHYERFLNFVGVESLGQIPMSEFDRAMAALEKKASAKK